MLKNYEYDRPAICNNCGYTIGVDSCCFTHETVDKNLKSCNNKKSFI
jgi:hypothetical protein